MTPPDDPGRGWALIHEYAEPLPAELRNEFIADMRNAEGMFTSGHISEILYRQFLAAAAKAIADRGATAK